MNDLQTISNQILNTDRMYKWVILKHADGVYALQGFHLIDGKWIQDGSTVRWSYIEAPLEHIRKQEQDNLK